MSENTCRESKSRQLSHKCVLSACTWTDIQCNTDQTVSISDYLISKPYDHLLWICLNSRPHYVFLLKSTCKNANTWHWPVNLASKQFESSHIKSWVVRSISFWIWLVKNAYFKAKKKPRADTVATFGSSAWRFEIQFTSIPLGFWPQLDVSFQTLYFVWDGKELPHRQENGQIVFFNF